MRIADVEVGVRYRTTGGPGARVCVLEKAKGGGLRVRIEAGSVWDGGSWVDAGSEAHVLARDLTSTWAEYEMACGDQGAPEPHTWSEEQASEEARRLQTPMVDPDRLLPAAYEFASEIDSAAWNQLTPAESELVWTSIINNRPRRQRPGAAAELLAGLPIAVARDLLAAYCAYRGERRLQTTSRSRSRLPDLDDGPYISVAREASRPAAPTVTTTFARAAGTLDLAVDDEAGSLYGTHYPTIDAFTLDDAAFAVECESTIKDSSVGGSSVRLPNHLSELVDRQIVDALGWVPIASGVTSGRRLHQPGCHILREGRRAQLRHASAVPLWYVALHIRNDLCGVCGGPTLAVPALAAHFMMASDAWQANDREQIEPWQLACFARYFGAGTTVGVMTSAKTRLVRALLDRFGSTDHGRDGWHLYNALAFSMPQEGVTEEEFTVHKRQAEAIRDEALEMAGLRASGWGSRDVQSLESAGAPHAARILFTLSGAIRY